MEYISLRYLFSLASSMKSFPQMLHLRYILKVLKKLYQSDTSANVKV